MDNNNNNNNKQEQQGNNNTKHTNNSVSKNGNLDCDDDVEIGKTMISDKHPNTIDSFWFALAPGTIAKPFDFVTVEQYFTSPSSVLSAETTTATTSRRLPRSSSHSTKTIGMVQDLHAILPNDDFHCLFQHLN